MVSKNFIPAFVAVLFLGVCISLKSTAQGCSDAGFCTVGSLKAQPADDNTAKRPKGRFSILTPFGLGDDDVFVFTPALQYDWMANERLTVQAKLTGNVASGNLGSASGPGDLFVSGTYSLTKSSVWQWHALVGVKIPLSDAGLEADGRPLPMQYQSSLGTFDIIAGVSTSSRHWLFAVALQQPLTETNQNAFLPGDWPSGEGLAYPPSRQLMRKADLLLRGSRQFNLSSSLTASLGLLGIYHLGEDEYVERGADTPRPIAGSEGLTLNTTGGIWWQASARTRVGLTAGVPLVVRDVRPDGLTRSFAIGPEISFTW